jgi:hypothetical protein
MELLEILKKIAVPRPDQSEALDQVAAFLKELLTSWGAPFTVQEFTLRPYSLFLLGLTTLILGVLFFFCIYKKKPILALITVLAIPALLIIEVEFNINIVSSLITKPSENIVISFKAPDAVREIIFAGHYDSKTDFYDHVQRVIIMKLLPLFLLLGIALSIWTFFVRRYDSLKKRSIIIITLILAACFTVYSFFGFLRLGGFVFMSKESESCGVIDNGTAVVTLLALARDINQGKVNIGKSNITLLISSGEEVGMQGARFYAQQRFAEKKPELPTMLVNLELVAQNGNMIYWKRVTKLFKTFNADPDLIAKLDTVWKEISGKPMDSIDRLSDDSYEFGLVGIPFITVGHAGKPGLGMGGFHCNTDNFDRFNPGNLKLMIRTLERFIESYR